MKKLLKYVLTIVLIIIFSFVVSCQKYPQVLPSRDGVVFSNPQVREVARVIELNDLLSKEIDLYRSLVKDQDTLNYYSELQIEKLDSLALNIDRKFGVVFKKYNELSIEYLDIKNHNDQLTKKNEKLVQDNKKVKRKLWVQRIVGVLGIAGIVILR